jgi:predicted dehydrogenase
MTSTPFDRRTFVKASAATAASAWLASSALAQQKQPAPAEGKKLPPLRVGLLGCGGRGTGAASDALHADSGAVLVALGDVLADRAKSCQENQLKDPAIAARVQVDKERVFLGFDALDKVLAADIDVILLATPPHWRPAQIAASVAAGKHIFAEKPYSVDAPGLRSVIESAKKAKEKNLSLVSGFCWRSSLPERAIYQRILDGGVGEIRTVYATYNGVPNAFVERKSGMSDMEWQIRNWFHFLWLGGDHIVEQAVHSVDKINWAMGNKPPARCWAVGGRAQRTPQHPGNIFDHFGVTYEWEDGKRAILQARQWENCPTDNTDYVYGAKGVAFINGWGPYHEIKGEKPWVYEGDTNSMYVEEHKEFFAGIRSGKLRHDGDWMTVSTMMAIMGRMAAYTGEVITWDQAMNSQERLGPAKYEMGAVPVSDVPRPGYTKFT